MLKLIEIHHYGSDSGMDCKLLTNNFRKVWHWACCVLVVDPPLFRLFSHLLLVTMFGWQSAKLNLQKFSCGWDCLPLLALLSSEVLAKNEGKYQEHSPSMWHLPMFIHVASTFGEKLPLVLIYMCVWYIYEGGTQWRNWLRHCATSRKVTGLIPNSVTGIFNWHNPSSCTMALGSTQPLTEMSTRNISWGVKAAGA